MDCRTHERGVGMLNTPYVKKDTIKNFFPVPNAVFDLGLHHMEINKLVGSDTLGYLSIEHVQQLAIHSKCGFCTGCFTGKYPVAPPTETMDIVYDKPLSQSKTNKKL